MKTILPLFALLALLVLAGCSSGDATTDSGDAEASGASAEGASADTDSE